MRLLYQVCAQQCHSIDGGSVYMQRSNCACITFAVSRAAALKCRVGREPSAGVSFRRLPDRTADKTVRAHLPSVFTQPHCYRVRAEGLHRVRRQLQTRSMAAGSRQTSDACCRQESFARLPSQGRQKSPRCLGTPPTLLCRRASFCNLFCTM
jgi:hypothetical protein